MSVIPDLVPVSHQRDLLANSSNDMNHVASRLDGYQLEQQKFNTSIASVVSDQGKQLEHLKSDNDRLFRLGEKLHDQLGDTNMKLGRVESDTIGLRRSLDRTDNLLNRMQSKQDTFNMDVIRRGTQLEERHNAFIDEQVAYNDVLKRMVTDTSKKLDKTSMGLVEVRSRADYLEQGQNRISSDVASVDGRVDKIQANQNKFNLDIVDKYARMEEQQKMADHYQKLFNSEVKARTVALQEKLGITSTRVESALNRVDDLQHKQDELKLDAIQVNQKVDKFQSDQYKAYSALAEHTVANQEKQLHFMDRQKSYNENFIAQMEALFDKQNAAEGNLELLTLRADTLQDDQAKIDSDIRLERKIVEDRLQEQVRYNQMLTERSAVVEARQSCFIDDQKSNNDLMLKRTKNIREQLIEASKKIDLVNNRVENIYFIQKKADLKQKESDNQYQDIAKKMKVLEHCMHDYHIGQKQMHEQHEMLVTLIATIDQRSKMMQNQLESMQNSIERFNKMCIKLEAEMASVERIPGEPSGDPNTAKSKETSKELVS